MMETNKISSFEKKPENNGTPEIAKEASTSLQKVIGIAFSNRLFRMSCSPCKA
jgi:hypothetical protein